MMRRRTSKSAHLASIFLGLMIKDVHDRVTEAFAPDIVPSWTSTCWRGKSLIFEDCFTLGSTATTTGTNTEEFLPIGDFDSYQAPQEEINRRRNLAIISHPDSGKTTMTEKLLLYGGALQQAGAVRQKADQRATQSDFMAIEQERGISISSTVMNFEYRGFGIRLMDTPGEH